jgi:SNF family Na+-dependent transporter
MVDSKHPESVAWITLICCAVCWLITFLAVWKGTRSMSKIVYVSVPLPILLLIILLIRGLFLEGAWDGIENYLWTPKVEDRWEPLGRGRIWSDAIG